MYWFFFLELLNDHSSIVLSVVVVCLLAYYSTSTFAYWKIRNVPYVKPWPFFGNNIRMTFNRENIAPLLFRMYKSFPNEPFSGCFMSRDPVLVVRDTDLICNILIRDFPHFKNRIVSFIDVNRELNPLSGNLFTLQGNRWRCLRQKISPVFTSGKLKTMFDQILECAAELVDRTGTMIETISPSIDVRELSAKFATDVIGTCAFGLDCQSLRDPNSEFRAMSKQVLHPRRIDVLKSVLRTINPKLVSALKLKDRPDYITDFYIKILKDAIRHRRENSVERKDFLQMLLDIKESSVNTLPEKADDENSALPDDYFDDTDVIANAFSFFVAGFENISLIISYVLYELALNPTVQDKLLDEIRVVQQKYKGIMTVEALKEMTYLDMVMSETLRKYPAAPVIFRRCTKDYVIPGTNVLIDKGIIIMIPTIAIHYDPRYYPEPDKFIPERFSLESKVTRPNGTYLPFGNGPRFCVGKLFAQMEMKVAVINVVSNYRLDRSPKTEIPLQFTNGSVFLMAKNGVWLKLEKRN